MIVLKFFLIIWSVLLIAGAFIPFLREQTWWLRAWTYARLQMLVLLLITALLYFLVVGFAKWFDCIIFFALLGGAITCLKDIFPFTQFGRKQTQDADETKDGCQFSMMVGNVLMENNKFGPYLEQIKKESPDIVFLIETNETWRDNLSELETLYPHKYLLPLEDFNGMLFYSRYEISGAEVRYLVQDYIPSLTFDLQLDKSKSIRIYGVHPRPPRPEDDTSDLDKELMFIANEAAHVNHPVIVTGDLNDVGWSSTTKKFLRTSGLKDPRHGRGLFNSYNAKIPIVRWPLDHLFHSKEFSLVEMKRLSAHGSDHFPLLIKLALVKPK